MDLEARAAALADAQRRLEDAERAVHDADTALARGRARGRRGAPARARARRRRCITPSCASPSSRGAERLFASGSKRSGGARSRRCSRRCRRRMSTSRCSARRSRRLRAELESIGPVNALAIEEHEEDAQAPRLPHGAARGPRRGEELAAPGDQGDRRHGARAVPRDVRAGARELPPDLHVAVRRRRVRPAPRESGHAARLRHRDPRVARAASARSASICSRAASARSSRCRCCSASFSRSRVRSACSTRWMRRSTTQNVGRFVRMLNQFKEKHAVHRHHAQSAHDHRSGGCGVRRDDAGAGRLVARERADARRRGGRAGARDSSVGLTGARLHAAHHARHGHRVAIRRV